MDQSNLAALAIISVPTEAKLPDAAVDMDADDEKKKDEEKKKDNGRWKWVYNDYCEHCNHHHFCTGPKNKGQATSSASAAVTTGDAEMQVSTVKAWQDWSTQASSDKKVKKEWTMDEWKAWSDAKAQKEAKARQDIKTDIWNSTLGTLYPFLQLPKE